MPFASLNVARFPMRHAETMQILRWHGWRGTVCNQLVYVRCVLEQSFEAELLSMLLAEVVEHEWDMNRLSLAEVTSARSRYRLVPPALARAAQRTRTAATMAHSDRHFYTRARTSPPLPHLPRDLATTFHICTGTGPTAATSALGLGSPSGWARRLVDAMQSRWVAGDASHARGARCLARSAHVIAHLVRTYGAAVGDGDVFSLSFRRVALTRARQLLCAVEVPCPAQRRARASTHAMIRRLSAK